METNNAKTPLFVVLFLDSVVLGYVPSVCSISRRSKAHQPVLGRCLRRWALDNGRVFKSAAIASAFARHLRLAARSLMPAICHWHQALPNESFSATAVVGLDHDRFLSYSHGSEKIAAAAAC